MGQAIDAGDAAGVENPSPRARRAWRWWLVAAFLALVAVGALLTVLPGLADVVDEGTDLRPYPAGHVKEVRIADTFTVYVDDESSRVGTDLISGLALVVLATASALTLVLLAAAGAARRLLVFHLVTALGLGFLALDELAGIHETIGHNLPFLADVPGVGRPDDLIIALYIIPAIAYVVVFRDVLRGSPLVLRLFVAAVACFGLSGVMDVADLPLDEPLEMLGAAAIAGGLVLLMAQHLGAALQLPALQALAPRDDRA
ncbi:MAG TPA: hypothetical protein VK506_05860 [Conexibacter sp.]|nr:hypothetical protein [Conexibacter sp.]